MASGLVLQTPLLWSVPLLSPMYGVYGFALTDFGWVVVTVAFALGLIAFLYALRHVTR